MNLWARVYRERRAIVLPVLLLLIANVAVLALGVWPLERRVRAGADEEFQAVTDLEQARRDDRDARMAQTRRQETDVDLARFYKEVLPGNLGSAQVVTQLWLAQVAKTHNVVFHSGTHKRDPIRDSQLTKVTSEATLTGTYRDIRNFLSTVESAAEFVIIEEVQLGDSGSGPQRSQPGEQLEIGIKASTYYLREQ